MKVAMKFEKDDCIFCGFQFFLPEEFIAQREEDHVEYYCPSCGRKMSFAKDTPADKLRGQLKDERAAHDATKEKLAALDTKEEPK